MNYKLIFLMFFKFYFAKLEKNSYKEDVFELELSIHK